MKKEAMTFKEVLEMVEFGIGEIEELQGQLKGKQFLQAGDVSRVLESVRYMLKDRVLFYNHKREQARIDELTK